MFAARFASVGRLIPKLFHTLYGLIVQRHCLIGVGLSLRLCCRTDACGRLLGSVKAIWM